MNSQGTARRAAGVSVLVLISPVSGLLFEMVLAWRYGAVAGVDAFRVAALILILGQQLFQSDLLAHVIVPRYAYLKKRGQELEAWRLVFTLLLLAAVGSGLTVTAIWLHTEAVVGFIAPGLAQSVIPDAVMLVRCFSSILMLTLVLGVVSGVLYCNDVFSLRAFLTVSNCEFNFLTFS